MAFGAASIKNILFIDLAFIGDVLLAAPTINALRGLFPNARLTLLVIPPVADIAATIRGVDEVLVYDKRGRDKGFFGMWRMAQRLKKYAFDFSVSINFSTRGAIIARLAGIPHRLAYDAQHADWFSTVVASSVRPAIVHETQNHLNILRPLGVDPAAINDTAIRLNLPEAARQSLAAKQEKYGLPKTGFILLCPCGSYDKKNLAPQTAAHVINHLAEKYPLYLIGGPAEGAALAALAKTARLPHDHVLAGTLTLTELAVWLKSAAALVTVDTGPLHIAQAVNCPTVAVFGPTDPAVWGPRGERDVVLYDRLPCSPCWGKGVCPGGPTEEKACIRSIDALKIIRAAEAIAAENSQ